MRSVVDEFPHAGACVGFPTLPGGRLSETVLTTPNGAIETAKDENVRFTWEVNR